MDPFFKALNRCRHRCETRQIFLLAYGLQVPCFDYDQWERMSVIDPDSWSGLLVKWLEHSLHD